VSDAAWEILSEQAIAGAGVLYFVALLAHLAEWALLRQVPVAEREPALAGAGGPGAPDVPGDAAAPEVPDEGTARRTAMAARLGLLLTCFAVVVHLVALVGRGMAAEPNRVPWGNMYEFTISGTFVVAALYLLTRRRFGLAWMAPIVVGVVVTLLMIAVIWLHEPVAPLREALNSYWLVIHVVSAIIATGAFTLGGIASTLFLVKSRAERRGTVGPYLARVPDAAGLDRVAYRMHAFAFPVWTFAVLITGPIWAHEAWARYWNWDPKEVWAFITWVVYAAYLHARATAGWRGRNAAILALIGMATLWFNFIGINYFTSSMHSYADAPVAPTGVVQVVEPPGVPGVHV